MQASNTPSELEWAFRAAEADGPDGPGTARRRLLPGSTLDVFTEVRFPSHDWALVVLSDERLQDRDLVLATGLTCRTKNGSIEVVAAPETESKLFCTLLADLLDQMPSSGRHSAAAVARRLTAWQRMLCRGPSTLMTAEERVGLYGELLVFRDVMLQAVGEDAVRSWTGPSGTPQDFTHLDASVEVKTTARQAEGSCRISNERQLDDADLRTLFLVHQEVTSVMEGLTLGELIDEMRGHPFVRADVQWFENSLLEYGWHDSQRDRYTQDRYALTRRRCFRVRDDFPRLTPTRLPMGIAGVTYHLDLSACAPYQVDYDAMRRSLAATAVEE